MNAEEELEREHRQRYQTKDLRHGIQRIIINLRLIHDLNQADLARMLETAQSTISRIESGEKMPTVNFFLRICMTLDYKLELNLVSRTKGTILNSDGLILRPDGTLLR